MLLQDVPLAGAVAAAATFWAVILILIWLSPTLSMDIKQQGADRVLASIHAIINGSLAVRLALLTSPKCDVKELWIGAPLVLFQGYLLVDLGSMIVCDIWKGWRPVDVSMFFHHIFVLVALSYALFLDVGVWFQSTLLVCEISTPFMSMFWYLKHSGQKESMAFTVNGVVFTASFFLCRIVYIPVNFYQFIALDFCQQSDNSAYGFSWPLICICYIAFHSMNLIWFKKLLSGAVATCRKRSKQASVASR